jgi:hypothetical protein
MFRLKISEIAMPPSSLLSCGRRKSLRLKFLVHLAGARAFSLWEKVAGEAGRMRASPP